MSRKRGANMNTLLNRMEKRGIKFKNRKEASRILLLMGYFHGYKSCGFTVKKTDFGLDANNLKHISFQNFTQVRQIYRINNELKVLFYPMITQVITSLKSHIIYFLVNKGGWYLKDIFLNCMNNTNNTSSSKKSHRRVYKSKHIIRKFKRLAKPTKSTYNLLMSHENMIKHHEDIPIWIFFEVTNLRQLAYFCGCLYKPCDISLEKYLGLLKSDHNNHGVFLSRHLNILADLRNAVAHDKIIFDCRFRSSNIKHSVMKKLQQDSHVKPIRFNSIVDYFILLVYYQYLLDFKSSIIKSEVDKLDDILCKFKDIFGHPRYYDAFGKKPLRKLRGFHFN